MLDFAKALIIASSLLSLNNTSATSNFDVAANSCPSVEIKNNTKTWSKRDDEALKSAKNGCLKNYSEEHCVIVFVKVGEGNYYVICGKRE